MKGGIAISLLIVPSLSDIFISIMAFNSEIKGLEFIVLKKTWKL